MWSHLSKCSRNMLSRCVELFKICHFQAGGNNDQHLEGCSKMYWKLTWIEYFDLFFSYPALLRSDAGKLKEPPRLLPEEPGVSGAQRRSLPPILAPRSRSPSPQPFSGEPAVPGIPEAPWKKTHGERCYSMDSTSFI